ncbi:MAG: hypothetical protein HY722_16015, partial [Planctomycetes bacterium]|nr:hypothetical protein [Planctomycetota bacterium]
GEGGDEASPPPVPRTRRRSEPARRLGPEERRDLDAVAALARWLRGVDERYDIRLDVADIQGRPFEEVAEAVDRELGRDRLDAELLAGEDRPRFDLYAGARRLGAWFHQKFLIALSAGDLDRDGAEPANGASGPTPAGRIEENLVDRVSRAYGERERLVGAEEMRRIERFILLTKIDEKWKDHLHAMDQLRAGIGYRGYAQQDPKIAYKKEGYELFQSMFDAVQEEVTDLILRVRVGTSDRVRDVWGGGGSRVMPPEGGPPGGLPRRTPPPRLGAGPPVPEALGAGSAAQQRALEAT